MCTKLWKMYVLTSYIYYYFIFIIYFLLTCQFKLKL